MIGHILGPRFILSTHSANIAKPGGKRMGLHTDQWWMPQPVAPVAQPHPTEQTDYPIEQIVAPAGSLAVFDGRLWHGTGAHTGGEDRLGVLATFCAPQFRPQENQVLGLDRLLWSDLSDKMKERLGFKPWNAYGRLESPTDPWVEPEPERIPELF